MRVTFVPEERNSLPVLSIVSKFLLLFRLQFMSYMYICKIPQGSDLIKKKVSAPSEKTESPVAAFVELEHYNAIHLIQVLCDCAFLLHWLLTAGEHTVPIMCMF